MTPSATTSLKQRAAVGRVFYLQKPLHAVIAAAPGWNGGNNQEGDQMVGRIG